MIMRGKRARVQSQSLLSRLGGISLFGVGMSWKAPEPERVVVKDVITSLEDKRALYSSAVMEEQDHVVQSVLNIRNELTNGLKRVGDNSPAKDAFRAMRAACRDFLDLTSVKGWEHKHGMLRSGGVWQQEEFLIELGKLRSVCGQQLATLGYLYGIDTEAGLASILPPDASGNNDYHESSGEFLPSGRRWIGRCLRSSSQRRCIRRTSRSGRTGS